MLQSWSRENKYSISHMSLPTGYGSNHEAVIYHYYHSGSNIYQQQHVLSSFVFAITHSTACISYLIFHERKKEKVFIKSWLSLSRKKNAKVLLDKNVHYIRFHHLYSLNVLW